MLRGILIGLDGSPFGDSATTLGLRWALAARAEGREVELGGLGIIDEPTIRKPTGLAIGGGHYKPIADEQHLAAARERVERVLDEFERRSREAEVRYRRLCEVGLPAEQILEEAQRFDLIVLGKQTYFQFATRQGPDSTLHDVLHDTPRPVVTVPDTLPASQAGGGGQTVVVGYDGSVQAARALQAFVHCGPAPKSEVHLVSVHSERQVAERTLERAADFLARHAIRPQRHPIESGRDAGPVVLEEALRLDAGLLVMGAYGRPTVREFFFGSATQAVLSQTPVPVFLFH